MGLGTTISLAVVSRCKLAAALCQVSFGLRAVRVVGFAARAAYLIGSYHPSLEGIYLAFSNAGFGASLANIFLVTAVWCARHVSCLPCKARPASGPVPAFQIGQSHLQFITSRAAAQQRVMDRQ